MGIDIRGLALRSLLGWAALPAAFGAPPPVPAPAGDFLRAEMDTSVDPGVDFFRYALGGWLQRTPIPASESAWDIGMILRERDFYFNPEKGLALVRQEYVAHLARLLVLLGRDEAGAKQAAGRVIRAPGDRGLLIFLDGRFLEDDYAACFPEGWNVRERVSKAILEDIRAFWASSIVV